jgi:hypothetical protein
VGGSVWRRRARDAGERYSEPSLFTVLERSR